MTYPVMDHEFAMLSNFNTFSAVAFSVGSFLLSAFLGLLGNYLFASHVSDIGKAAFFLSWILLGLSIVCFVVGGLFLFYRSQLENKIKLQTKMPSGI